MGRRTRGRDIRLTGVALILKTRENSIRADYLQSGLLQTAEWHGENSPYRVPNQMQ